jgi:hypothetical protein
VLPADSHVHSQWSYDTFCSTSMAAACERALELGVPAVAFHRSTWTSPAPLLATPSRSADAVAVAEAAGFSRGGDPYGFRRPLRASEPAVGGRRGVPRHCTPLPRPAFAGHGKATTAA